MVHITRPTLHGLNDCALLDASYTTQRVWQLGLRVEADDIQASFHLVHLPRPITLNDLAADEDLTRFWQRGDCLLAARLQNETAGFLHLVPDPETRVGVIRRHVVATAWRRQKVGSALFERALEWGRERHLRGVIVTLSTKNYPAISFYLAHGFSFSGFNEHFFGNRDITLDFARTLR